MTESRRFAVYFSHSWHPEDVELNLLVWTAIAERCDLLVDDPGGRDVKPPYYVHRLEDLMRRADLFLCVLTCRPRNDETGLTGDAALACSAGSLFEIRLAERADRPRLILYDRRTRFKSPKNPTPHATYQAFDRDPKDVLPDRGQVTIIQNLITEWLGKIADSRRPRLYTPSDRSLVLLPEELSDAEPIHASIEHALTEADYEPPDRIKLRSQSDTDVFRNLTNVGLLVAELGGESVRELYAVAHALAVPTIRMLQGPGTAPEHLKLPWILSGHPGGYQHDIVQWQEPADLTGKIEPRASAMFRITRPLGREDGYRHFKSRRYKAYNVFVSHCLQPGERKLVDDLVALLENEQIAHFEYFTGNESGEDWKARMCAALKEATHFIAVLTDGYEASTACDEEWSTIQSSRPEVKIIPFLLNGRVKPHPRFGSAHHRSRVSGDPRRDAEAVMKRVLDFPEGREQ